VLSFGMLELLYSEGVLPQKRIKKDSKMLSSCLHQ